MRKSNDLDIIISHENGPISSDCYAIAHFGSYFAFLHLPTTYVSKDLKFELQHVNHTKNASRESLFLNET